MAVITKEDVIPTLIANTTMKKGFVDGVHKAYEITPLDGYVLHDNRCDEEVLDPVTLLPIGEMLYRYATGMVSARADYDFNTVVADTITDIYGNIIAVNKVGSFEFFAVPASAIPKNQIYGGGNDHEII
jgi:hypothetical protein